MAIRKEIEIDGRKVAFAASAAIPRMYRIAYRSDIFKDLNDLAKTVSKGDETASMLDTFSLEVFENVAYIMAKHADANVPNTVEEWLDGFNTFSIYQVLPEILELWRLNQETQAESKKKLERLTVK